MDIVVEIHVPLGEALGTEGSYAFPWIDQVEDFLAEQEVAEVHDEGEEYGEAYVFFITGAAEAGLLAVASRVAAVPGNPSGVFAMVTNDEAEEIGLGRRVELALEGPRQDRRSGGAGSVAQHRLVTSAGSTAPGKPDGHGLPRSWSPRRPMTCLEDRACRCVIADLSCP
jgi:hypothetical protein